MRLNHFNNKKEVSASEKGLNLISAVAKLCGNIQAVGRLEIRGNVNGMIKMDGELIVREGANIEGNIEAVDVLVEGTIRGNINAVKKISLGKTSVVYGDITVGVLIVEEGAKYGGKVEMKY